MISALINISYHVNTSSITQIIRIDAKRGHFKYFLNNKYIAGRKLDNKLRGYYIGDGTNIIFQKEAIHKNVIAITYKIIGSIQKNFDDIEFTIFAPVPGEFLCLDCRYFRDEYNRCLYFKKMNIKFKKHCIAYEQKF